MAALHPAGEHGANADQDGLPLLLLLGAVAGGGGGAADCAAVRAPLQPAGRGRGGGGRGPRPRPRKRDPRPRAALTHRGAQVPRWGPHLAFTSISIYGV